MRMKIVMISGTGITYKYNFWHVILFEDVHMYENGHRYSLYHIVISFTR